MHELIYKFESIKKTCLPDALNIIIRTSGRPNYFSNCIESIRKNSPDSILHIILDSEIDIEYVEHYAKDLNYVYYLVNKLEVSKICKNIKPRRENYTEFIPNYYFNIIKPYLKGWCIIIDDDDEMVNNPNYAKSENVIYLHKTHIGRTEIPFNNKFGQEPEINNISTLCIVFHSSNMLMWQPYKCGDFDFISDMYNSYKVEWKDFYVSRVQKGDNLGRKNDIMKKPISVIIAAYNADKFIEECLDSVFNQTYFVDNEYYEVLVGVDGCEKTLDKLKMIQ
jgi:hypothetical protein